MKNGVIAVIGPTASGKSALSLRLAREIGGEIVCMDSMQIYRGMNIGTAKPTQEEQREVPHHMLDIVSPTDSYDVATYACDAGRVMGEILSRGRIPILTGGTGLYLRALMYGLQLGTVAADEAFRTECVRRAETEDGRKKLWRELWAVDPVSAGKFHYNDFRRIMRALEVYRATGRPISSQSTQREIDSPFSFLLLGMEMERSLLYQRIDRRAEEMLRQGLADEVRGLLDSGVPPQVQAMQGIGYKEMIPYLTGKASLDETRSLIARNTRHYAKRQMTWFRSEERIHWLDSSSGTLLRDAMTIVQDWR